MSKGIKRIASIALPIAGSYFGPIGAAIGGAIGGAVNGGGLPGIALGAISGYGMSGLGKTLLGSAAHTLGPGVAGPVSPGSGIIGSLTGGGFKALANTGTQIASSVAGAAKEGVGELAKDEVSRGLMTMGNQAIAQGNADAVEEAAGQQNAAYGQAMNTLAPYRQLGADSVAKINSINSDPAGYIQNNPVYQSLANDAQQRLLANQAAKGKVGSGGTADALQERLLSVGNGLLQQDLANLNTSAGMGQNSANNTANIQSQQGGVNAASTIGQNNALVGGYDNQLRTLLALNGVNNGRTPTYNPAPVSL